MQSSFKLFGILLIASATLQSCDFSKTKNEEPIPQPTPLSLDVPFYFGDFVIPSNNPTTVEGVALGRMLFYDPRLSADNTISCATCHQQEKGFVDGLARSRGINGRRTNIKSMSLVNVLWENRMFWNGRVASLEEQALHPIQDPNEMGMNLQELVGKLQSIEVYKEQFKNAFGSETVTPDKIGKALAQFQRTLISGNSKYDKYLREEVSLTAQEEQGMILFFTHPEPAISLRGGNCGDCHLSLTTAGSKDGFRGFHNNGLDTDENLRPGLQTVTGNPADRGKFKTPNLRNIMVRAPYMHDGRFASIEEVLDHYNEHVQMSSTLDVLILEGSNKPIIAGEPVKLHLTQNEKAAIIAFLHTLTDQEFLSNPKFSNPFQQ
jgi:cytochrome c peroxidase